jgi:hypothetical protein
VIGPGIPGELAAWGLLPCCGAIEMAPPSWDVVGPPVEVTPPLTGIPIIGPPTLLPELPLAPQSIAPPAPTPIQRIPEPSSLGLMLSFLFLFATGGCLARINKQRTPHRPSDRRRKHAQPAWRCWPEDYRPR